ncbi:MAG: bifunctional phosphoribosyl-AMP cyclohydrolase/phosphoribosyl-ATP diphosphatase HisIE [Thermoplasmatota archaeon]
MTDWVERIDFQKGGGLVPCIAQDHATGRVLMLAYMDEAALRKTLATGWVHYLSRTRGPWRKGETSGHTQRLVGVALDCDGDTLLLQVDQTGPACHRGSATCFDAVHGRSEPLLIDLQRVMRDPGTGWTARLLGDANLRRKKVVEEAAEQVMASTAGDRAGVIHEAADLWYHSLVAAYADGVLVQDVLAELARRRDDKRPETEGPGA